ncbi:MAG: hypothetical protein KatS3mg118_2934 [Paracoccaceae bacterium]|nr:MAG: DUF2155 domain-containing protein [Alphaproteobacteria bacterium]GIX14975.1 MAG: hypothetical protein KatS3mg118_2934 [Paracoccaceae bacterium]
MRAALAIAALALGLPAAAQGLGESHFKPAPPAPAVPRPDPAPPAERPPVTSLAGRGAVLRGLDKMTGRVESFEMAVGETRRWQRLEIRLEACRHPGPGEAEDAFAFLVIRDVRHERPDFTGWMFASSPALSALDHPRYDVWVASCRTASGEMSVGSAQN